MLRGMFNVRAGKGAAEREAALLDLVTGPDVWLRCCAIWAAHAHPYGRLAAEIESQRASDIPLVAETVRLALDAERRTANMLTTIEKAILLERVD